MVGLRGVGKTVLLDRIREDAEVGGICALRIEAPEGRSLPSILAPQLRIALLKLSNREAAKQLAHRALRGLAGFVGALKVKYQDIEVGLDFDSEPGLADNGDLESDLQDLLEVVGEAAKADGTCVGIFVDELQYVKEDELAAFNHGIAPDISAATASNNVRCRAASIARPNGKGQVLCREAIRVP